MTRLLIAALMIAALFAPAHAGSVAPCYSFSWAFQIVQVRCYSELAAANSERGQISLTNPAADAIMQPSPVSVDSFAAFRRALFTGPQDGAP